jgi:hypothetical protein
MLERSLLSLLSLLSITIAGCATASSSPASNAAHGWTSPSPRRGFVVLVAEHERNVKKAADLGPPILAISSTDPTNAADHSLGTSDEHYSIKVHWRPQGVDAARIPCLDVTVTRRGKHPLPDADMRGCITPSDGETWLGQVSSDAGKSLGVVVTFLPPNAPNAKAAKLATVAP